MAILLLVPLTFCLADPTPQTPRRMNILLAAFTRRAPWFGDVGLEISNRTNNS